MHDRKQAQAVVEAIIAVDPSLALLTLPGSVVGELATNAGLQVFREAFADRAYMPDGTLVPRTQDGAVISDVDTVAARVARMASSGEVEAIDGTTITVHADSVCVHGDSPSAVAMARAIRGRLDADGFDVASFIRG